MTKFGFKLCDIQIQLGWSDFPPEGDRAPHGISAQSSHHTKPDGAVRMGSKRGVPVSLPELSCNSQPAQQ